MPKYNVTVTAYCEVFIEADSAEEATERACNEIDYGDFEMDTGEQAVELKTEDEIASYRRHANARIEAA